MKKLIPEKDPVINASAEPLVGKYHSLYFITSLWGFALFLFIINRLSNIEKMGELWKWIKNKLNWTAT